MFQHRLSHPEHTALSVCLQAIRHMARYAHGVAHHRLWQSRALKAPGELHIVHVSAHPSLLGENQFPLGTMFQVLEWICGSGRPITNAANKGFPYPGLTHRHVIFRLCVALGLGATTLA